MNSKRIKTIIAEAVVSFLKENEYNGNELPVPVKIQKSWTGEYYNIQTDKLDYETAMKLGDNLTSDAIKYGQEKDGRKYDANVINYSNDVSLNSYDYKTREATFSASTIKDVKNWLEMYRNYVYPENNF